MSKTALPLARASEPLQGRSTPKGSKLAFNDPLPPAVLNIEDKLRSNLFAWRGQFSPQLIESLLGSYVEPWAAVLDPFMGSGTVLVEAARCGHAVYGTEVNPAAYLIARLYEFCADSRSLRARTIQEVDAVMDGVLGGGLPLFRQFEPASESCLASVISSIRDRRVRTLLEAVVILADTAKEHERVAAYRQRWRDVKKVVTALPFSETPVKAFLGDARKLALPEGSIDFVLTSPPYINVFNYHHNYRDSVEALGWQPLVVARSEIGSNRKFRQNRFLTVVQYCIDMALVLAEMRRVGTGGLRAILVLGRESNVQKTPFYNGRIVCELARQIAGFHLVQKQQRVFTNRFGQSIFEDLLHLEAGSRPSSRHSIVSDARELGREVLADARARVPDDRREYLEEALAVAVEVLPSPILDPSFAKSAG
jgi:hypothetical protein